MGKNKVSKIAPCTDFSRQILFWANFLAVPNRKNGTSQYKPELEPMLRPEPNDCKKYDQN